MYTPGIHKTFLLSRLPYHDGLRAHFCAALGVEPRHLDSQICAALSVGAHVLPHTVSRPIIVGYLCKGGAGQGRASSNTGEGGYPALYSTILGALDSASKCLPMRHKGPSWP